MQPINLTNKRFGFLVFLTPTEQREGGRSVVWECLCDCGKTCYRSVSYLSRAAIPSCGCQRYGKPAPNRTDLTGQSFGILMAVRISHRDKWGQMFWECLCECGKSHTAAANKLKCGEVKSCGCNRWHIKHGLCGTRLYTTWSDMKQRVFNPNSESYHNYGGRGISIYPEWLDVQKFYEYIGHPPNNTASIDRIDNDGNYEPNNVRWATPKQQGENKRTNRPITAFGETRLAREWTTVYGIPDWTIRYRLGNGWKEEHAVSWPTSATKYKTRVALL